MGISGVGGSGGANYYASLFKTPSTPSPTSNLSAPSQTPQQLLKTANDSVFKMSDLMKRARSLESMAGYLRPGDASGLDSINKQTATILNEINAIGLKGKTTSSTPTPNDKPVAAPTLSEVRTTLAEMQTVLRENIRKVGASSISAINSGAFTSRSEATNPFAAWSASLKAQRNYFL